jgi:hypothetical protein
MPSARRSARESAWTRQQSRFDNTFAVSNGRVFTPHAVPGTAPNGHFDAVPKPAGHGRGTKWAQDGHKAKRRPFGAAHIQF